MSRESHEFSAIASIEDGHAVIRLRGDVDAVASVRLEHLAAAMLDDSPNDLTLDLAEVTFMDSSGLRSLVSISDRCRRGSAAMSVAHPSQVVRRLLMWTGLDGVLAIDGDPPQQPDTGC